MVAVSDQCTPPPLSADPKTCWGRRRKKGDAEPVPPNPDPPAAGEGWGPWQGWGTGATLPFEAETKPVLIFTARAVGARGVRGCGTDGE